MAKVRTNIEIEDTYVRRIMDRYGLHTKTEAVDFALRTVAGPESMTKEEVLALRGSNIVGDVPADRPPRTAQ